ncbi:DUF1643 domain-containing protein, partial [Streptomyces sp. NPDC002082]|uniref:DUF1643 domain-containing protein n=1 Tax=Streptomyces sp. NPDC002082 TaxID=3154772 RepID=UPI00332E28C0
SRRGRRICAVLLNPSTSGGATVSAANVERVAARLGYGRLEIANLLKIATKESKALVGLAEDPKLWLDSREALTRALSQADDLLFGWGHAPLAGAANRHKNAQTQWLLGEAQRLGHTQVWMMDGLPRHPSRWHQYVGPQRGLISGGDFASRAVSMLTLVPIQHLLAVQDPGC